MWSTLLIPCILVGSISVFKFIRLYETSEKHQQTLISLAYSRFDDFSEYGADEMKKKVRLLCWVMTSPKNHNLKAIHVKNTWGKRCNILVFMTTKPDPNLPYIILPVKDGRGQLWKKSQEALKYIYNHYLDSFDWILKADDDTLFFPENARYLLSRYDPKEPLWMGCKMKMLHTPVFLSGGAGYIFSKQAVKIFVEEAIKDNTYCYPEINDWADDLQIGKCFEKLQVKLIDTRDENALHRFLPLSPFFHLKPLENEEDRKSWWWSAAYYKDETYFGGDCCSNTTISFHYVSPEDQYLFYNVFYNIRPYGKQSLDNSESPPKPPPDETLTELQFLNKEARRSRLQSDINFIRNIFKKHKSDGQ
ncbi:glycoprotein-N-acetylgalactosamine 3-beta-galactosyltransferase 1-like isoform X1 [Artemia franciscana]|uniref:glycoprotein-N-acetylgalactosamine 3-beta-galactosyltransferase 1-like isoform X1 n=2 Tax=Artemia franciscana TaxID=6661 RepID=UPI0032DA2D4E